MIYVYGNKEVKDGIKCSPAFKEAISNATLVYTDDSTIASNYKAIGVEVKEITPKKQVKKSKSKTEGTK